MIGGSTRQRVSRFEDHVAELRTDVGGLSADLKGFGGRIDKLLGEVTSTDSKSAERRPP